MATKIDPKLKEAKDGLKNAKQQVTACRKAKAAAEKAFTADPAATEPAQAFRGATSAFVKAVRSANKFAVRVDALS